jgi:hypothetical protein
MFCAGLFSIADLLDSDFFGHELPFVPVLRVSHRLRNRGNPYHPAADHLYDTALPPAFQANRFCDIERISILGGAELQRCKNGEAMRLQPLAYLRG